MMNITYLVISFRNFYKNKKKIQDENDEPLLKDK